jgi:hypothetical protein
MKSKKINTGQRAESSPQAGRSWACAAWLGQGQGLVDRGRLLHPSAARLDVTPCVMETLIKVINK